MGVVSLVSFLPSDGHSNIFGRLFGGDDFGTVYEMKNEVWSCYTTELGRMATILIKAGSHSRYEAYRYAPKLFVDAVYDGRYQDGVLGSKPTVEKMIDSLWDNVVNKGDDYQKRLWDERNQITVTDDEVDALGNFIVAKTLNCAEKYFDEKSGNADAPAVSQ